MAKDSMFKRRHVRTNKNRLRSHNVDVTPGYVRRSADIPIIARCYDSAVLVSACGNSNLDFSLRLLRTSLSCDEIVAIRPEDLMGRIMRGRYSAVFIYHGSSPRADDKTVIRELREIKGPEFPIYAFISQRTEGQHGPQHTFGYSSGYGRGTYDNDIYTPHELKVRELLGVGATSCISVDKPFPTIVYEIRRVVG